MPVSFYDARVRATTFSPKPNVAMQRSESGLVITSRFAQPVWTGSFTTPPLTRSQRTGWLDWLDDCVDRNLRVDFVHPIYAYPQGYDSSSWSMVGNATLISVDDLRHITVSDLDSGLSIDAGSRLCIVQGTRVCYRKIREDIASPNPISQQITLSPRIPPGVFAAGAEVRLTNPYCRMMVVPESWDADEDIEDIPLTFEMMETLT